MHWGLVLIISLLCICPLFIIIALLLCLLCLCFLFVKKQLDARMNTFQSTRTQLVQRAGRMLWLVREKQNVELRDYFFFLIKSIQVDGITQTFSWATVNRLNIISASHFSEAFFFLWGQPVSFLGKWKHLWGDERWLNSVIIVNLHCLRCLTHYIAGPEPETIIYTINKTSSNWTCGGGEVLLYNIEFQKMRKRANRCAIQRHQLAFYAV